MKVLLFIIGFCIVSASFAAEVETECPAMSQNREKNVKVVKPRVTSKKGNMIQ